MWEEYEEDWGAFDEEDIIESPTINQSDSQLDKAAIGENKSKGRKPNRIRIAMAGNAKGQSKLTVGNGGPLLEGK